MYTHMCIYIYTYSFMYMCIHKCYSLGTLFLAARFLSKRNPRNIKKLTPKMDFNDTSQQTGLTPGMI